MAVQENTWNVANRMHSNKDSDNPALNHIITGADEIFDDEKGKKQSTINAETDASLADRYTKAETYSKSQLDNMITTPETPYIDVDTYAELEALTEHPEGAIYRVANYDGTQAVTNKYAEYSWDGTQYKLMAVRDHGIDISPKHDSSNIPTSGGTADLISEQSTIGKKKLSLTDFYGYTTKNGYTINSDGTIEAATSSSASKYRTIYTNDSVNKGAILHFTGTSNRSARFAVGISSIPITDDNITSVQLTMLLSQSFTGDMSVKLIVPFDGYIVYYRFTDYWTSVKIGVYNSTLLQDISVLDVSKLNNAQYSSLADAIAAVPTTLQKGGMTIMYQQLVPATYTVVKTEGLEEQPTGTELLSDPGIDDGTYNASQLSAFATLPTSTGAGNAVTYWMAVAGDSITYTKWVVSLAHSSDNKYVQFRYMSSSTANADFTNVANWQGVDDEPTDFSNGLVESGGVVDYVERKIGRAKNYGEGKFVNSAGNLTSNADYGYTSYIPCSAGDTIAFSPGGNTSYAGVFFCFYDSSKTFLKYYTANAAPRTVTAPADTAFVRGSIYLAAKDASFCKVNGKFVWKIKDAVNSYIINVIDVSVANAVEGVSATYATLATAIAAVPSAYKAGGVTIKYIDSTDGKYKQYRLTNTSWSTTVSDWEADNLPLDEKPLLNSKNAVKGGGVFDADNSIIAELNEVYVVKNMRNGTPQNTGNANQISVLSIPVDGTDKTSVTIDIERPNTEGYSYRYTPCFYDSNGTLITSGDQQTSPTFIITAISARELRVGIGERNIEDNTYNPLRTTDFVGYKIKYKYGKSYREKLDESLEITKAISFPSTQVVCEISKGLLDWKDNLLFNNENNKFLVIADRRTVKIDISDYDYLFVANAYNRSTGVNAGALYGDNTLIQTFNLTGFFVNIASYKSQYSSFYIWINATTSTLPTIIGVRANDIDKTVGYENTLPIISEIQPEKMVTSNGSVVTNNGKILSPFIPCKKGDNILFRTLNGTDANAVLTIYDSSKTYLRYYAQTVADRLITVPDDDAAYFRIAFSKGYYGTYVRVNGYLKWVWDETVENVAKASVVGVDDVNSIVIFNPRNEVAPIIRNMLYAKSDDVTPLLLVHFSDLHANDTINLSRIVSFAKSYGYETSILNTGDIVQNSYNQTDFSWFTAVDGHEKIMNVIGNHDTAHSANATYDWTAHNGRDAYERYISPFISQWDVVQPSGAGENDYYPCYYYKDYAAQSLRLICIDIMNLDATQVTWLNTVLDDAKDNELSVVVATHFPGIEITGLPCKFTSLKGYITGSTFNAYNPTSDMTLAVKAIDDFKTAGGKFVCWICGHTHRDILGTITDYTDQLVVCISTAQYASTDVGDYMSHQKGRRTQDCFNLIAIDTDNKLVKIARIGSNIDTWMRKKETISVNYETLNIIQ